jgi:hypothetical protein
VVQPGGLVFSLLGNPKPRVPVGPGLSVFIDFREWLRYSNSDIRPPQDAIWRSFLSTNLDMLKLPTVQVSRRDAKALISERIKEGRRASKESYEASSKPAERRYAKWDNRNFRFLIELFGTDEIAIEYKAIAKFVLTGTYRSPERAEQHQKSKVVQGTCA